jgi:hypothetical protein
MQLSFETNNMKIGFGVLINLFFEILVQPLGRGEMFHLLLVAALAACTAANMNGRALTKFSSANQLNVREDTSLSRFTALLLHLHLLSWLSALLFVAPAPCQSPLLIPPPLPLPPCRALT